MQRQRVARAQIVVGAVVARAHRRALVGTRIRLRRRRRARVLQLPQALGGELRLAFGLAALALDRLVLLAQPLLALGLGLALALGQVDLILADARFPLLALAGLLALEREQAREREEREARIRQDQIDLTERERQAEAERKQRLREQYEAIQRERREAERQAKLAAERLRQLEDARPAPPPQPNPSPDERPAVRAGNNGTDDDLRARYALALHQTADASWNRSLAPEATPCKVAFTQIPGGEVIDVRFLSCPFNCAARESVERALRRGHMPYEGFESVFERSVTLTFCHPQEACPR